ncbi:uncharacterized protein LOC127427966 isoform X2 [Myxocyprinus asiaticus]|uniref:uncharacterized protein LOC127427966 isoform X2 n=1 Tax=Myxocyprinus asiaticus TaxID=70543 RepID=UPI002222A2F5|nr:uncharacterized protein LOC127427966 isoform X2 [Myxocyprinus asiaticus]
MSKLQGLNVFLTERLTLAAQEILKAVEDIFRDYNDEICRSRQEIQLLKRKLHEAGVQFHSETQPCSSEIQGKKYTQTFSEEQWRSEHYEKDTEMHMKLEVYTQQEENGEQMRVFNETTSLLPCMDVDHNQTVSKGVATQMMENCENNFTFINHGAQIKNEPDTDPESDTTCKAQRIIRYSSDDTEDSDASSNDIKIKVNHIGSPAHNTQPYDLPFRNQEMLAQHRMELAQISERWAEEERKKAAAKARSQKHKQKVYGNPELLEAYRKKERERYQRRKSQGKVKSAKDLNPIQLRRQQKRWRDNSAAYRRKKAFQDVLDNIKEDIIEVIPEQMPATSTQHFSFF